MGTMDDNDDWKRHVGKPIEDLVPPAPNMGDPLPPESMKLREELVRKDKERIRKKREAEAGVPPGGRTLRPIYGRVPVLPVLPVDPEAEKAVDELMGRARQRDRVTSRPIYKDVLSRALRLSVSEKLDLIAVLIDSLRSAPDSPSDEEE